MRVTVTIDDDDIRELMRLTGLKSRSAAIREAIRGFIHQIRLQRVLDLQGSMIVDDIWEESRRLDIEAQEAQYRKSELLGAPELEAKHAVES